MREIKISQSITQRESKSIETFMREAAKYPPLSNDEEPFATVDQLIKHNMLFVISIAKQYHFAKVNLSDLIQEGLTGLIEAANRYDPTKGFKFISYAVWWIRQRIINYIENLVDTIRIPIHIRREMHKYSKTHNKSFSDCCATFNVVTTKSLDEIDPLTEEPMQLPSDLKADDFEDNQYVSSLIKRVMSELNYKERKIIEALYLKNRTRSDIGEELGITHERVRQMQHKALKKMKMYDISNNL